MDSQTVAHLQTIYRIAKERVITGGNSSLNDWLHWYTVYDIIMSVLGMTPDEDMRWAVGKVHDLGMT